MSLTTLEYKYLLAMYKLGRNLHTVTLELTSRRAQPCCSCVVDEIHRNQFFLIVLMLECALIAASVILVLKTF